MFRNDLLAGFVLVRLEFFELSFGSNRDELTQQRTNVFSIFSYGFHWALSRGLLMSPEYRLGNDLQTARLGKPF